MKSKDMKAGEILAYSSSQRTADWFRPEKVRLLDSELWSRRRDGKFVLAQSYEKPGKGYGYGGPTVGYPILVGRGADPTDPKYADLRPDSEIPDGLRVDLVTAAGHLYPLAVIAEVAAENERRTAAQRVASATAEEQAVRKMAALATISLAVGRQVNLSSLADLEAVAALLAPKQD